MKAKAFILLVSLLSWLVGPGFALEWGARQLTLVAAPGATEVRGKFDFSNPSGAVVQILDLNTSCDCTVAKATAPTIAVGGRGAINITFAIGKRTGLQEKKIYVQTDESPEQVVLELKVQLPEAPAPR